MELIETPDDYIVAKLKQRNHNIWIGGSDKNSEGLWRWSDGSTWGFTNWGMLNGKQQPNNQGGQNCIEYEKQTWKWNDIICDEYKRKFLCSRKLSSGNRATSSFF